MTARQIHRPAATEQDGLEEKQMKRKVMKLKGKSGMELVQVAILVALAIALGLIFKTEITDFVNQTFAGLDEFN